LATGSDDVRKLFGWGFILCHGKDRFELVWHVPVSKSKQQRINEIRSNSYGKRQPSIGRQIAEEGPQAFLFEDFIRTDFIDDE
jgi:hypothetical protein